MGLWRWFGLSSRTAFTACQRQINAIKAVALVGLMTACQGNYGGPNLSPNDYGLLQDALRESKSLRQQVHNDCVRDYKRDRDRQDLQFFSELLNVQTVEVPSIVCMAFLDAVAIGIIDYADYVSIEQGEIDEALAIRIFEIIIMKDQESI